MTREETVERIKVMQAFVDGKQIQYKEDDGRWKDVKDPIWARANEYRIKPEPKYRPFKNAEECWQEMLKHQPFGWIKDKEDGTYVMVTKVSDGRDDMAINANYNWRLDGILEYFTFADGKPFGIKEE